MRIHPIIITAGLLAAAAPHAAAQTGDCSRVFTFVTETVRANYAGWDDKVTPATRDSLDRLTDRLRARAAAAGDASACVEHLRAWTAFFQDGHLGIGFSPAGGSAAASDDAVRARFAAWPRVAVTEEDVRTALDRRAGRLDPAEGIWESIGSPYRLAVVRAPDGDGFAAVVLRADGAWWTAGQVKARFAPAEAGYAVRFYLRDHSERAMTARIDRNLMRFSDGFVWARLYPAAEDDVAPEAYTASLNGALSVRRMDDSTMLVQVPSMHHTQAPLLDSLLRAHHDEIVRTPNLVIDVRDNGGGSDLTYQPLLPLIYTDTVRSPGVSIRATGLNVENFEDILADSTFPESSKPAVRELVAGLRASAGGMYSRGGSAWAADSVLPLPRRVGVLMNGGCASSCEQFVLAARASRKVTLYGENTAGVLDFANVARVATPDPSIRLNYPTSRSNRLPADPVDPHGIAPQVRVPGDEIFPLDWVRRALSADP